MTKKKQHFSGMKECLIIYCWFHVITLRINEEK